MCARARHAAFCSCGPCRFPGHGHAAVGSAVVERDGSSGFLVISGDGHDQGCLVHYGVGWAGPHVLGVAWNTSVVVSGLFLSSVFGRWRSLQPDLVLPMPESASPSRWRGAGLRRGDFSLGRSPRQRSNGCEPTRSWLWCVALALGRTWNADGEQSGVLFVATNWTVRAKGLPRCSD